MDSVHRSDLLQKKTLVLALLISCLSTPMLADQVATTQDGKKVLIKDDGTWRALTFVETVKLKLSKTDNPKPSDNPKQDKSLSEWKELRNNESTYKGKTVTWRVKILMIGLDTGNVFAFINSGNYPTSDVLLIPNNLTSSIHKEDIIEVKGRFEGINQDGAVVLTPLAVKNLGVE